MKIKVTPLTDTEKKRKLKGRLRVLTPLVLERIDICITCGGINDVDLSCIYGNCDFHKKIVRTDTKCIKDKW